MDYFMFVKYRIVCIVHPSSCGNLLSEIKTHRNHQLNRTFLCSIIKVFFICCCNMRFLGGAFFHYKTTQLLLNNCTFTQHWRAHFFYHISSAQQDIVFYQLRLIVQITLKFSSSISFYFFFLYTCLSFNERFLQQCEKVICWR